MRRRLIVFVSVGLNIILAGFLFAWMHRPPTAPASTGLQAAGPPKIRTEVVVRKQFFSWQSVESADYPAYIANLREIGCPEQTVRDIIIADVNQLYARKRTDEVITPDQQWWHADPDTNVVAAARAKTEQLEQERRTLLATLLGPNWDATYPASTKQLVALNGPVLGEIAPDAKQTVQEIVARSQDRIKAYVAAQMNAGKPADPAELERLHKQTRNELAQVLTPAQLEEFLLRYSQTAANLRSQFHGFEVTPEEFRAMFDARDPIEEQLPLVTGDAPAVAAQRAALEKQEAEAIKNALGPERYEQYRMSQDTAYRDAVTLAQQAGAPASVVQSLYELNKASQQEQDRIRSDPTLTPEQKDEQLKAVAQQQQAASDQLLGVAPPPTPPPLPPLPVQIHAYSPGETVDMIAARYGVSANSIFNANPNVDFNQLSKGTSIKIPKVQP